MFTVLFSDTSYNRLGVRLFLYPPLRPRGEPPLRSRGERPKGEGPRNREPKKQEYRTEAVLIADLGEAIDNAILWTGLLKNLEQANAHALSEWKESLNGVKQEADKLLKGLENLELPDDLKTHVEALLAKARHLSRILPNNLPENVQAINSRTDLRILPSLIKELQAKLGQVDGLLSKKLRKKK